MTKRLATHFQDVSYRPSQEGLVDAFKSFFGSEPEAPKVKEDAEEDEIEWSEHQYLLRFLSDRSAIQKLVLKEGQIDGRWISRKLLGQDTTPDALGAAINSHVSTAKHVLSTLEPGIQNLLKFMKSNAQAVKDSEDPVREVYKLVERTGVEKLTPLKLSDADFKKLLPSTEIYHDEHYKTWLLLNQDRIVHPARHLPALTHEQIYTLGRAVQTYTKQIDSLRAIPCNDEVLWGPYEGDRADLGVYYDAVRGYDGPENYLFVSKLATNYGWVAVAGEIVLALEYAITAILTWIYRSINVAASPA